MTGYSACRRVLQFLMVAASLAAPAPAQTGRGLDLLNSGQYPEAEQAFRASLKTNPSDIPARYYLGLCLLRQDQYREALELFQNVPRSRDRAEQPPVPSQYQIQIALAQAHLGLKQYDEAWENLESAKTLAPRSPEVYVCQGRYYLEREKYQEAIQELEKAISIDENNAEAYYYEGLAYYGAGMPESAVTALKKFLQLAPYAPEAGKAREIIAKLC